MPILIITLYLGNGSQTYDSCGSSTLLHQKLACRTLICLQILFSSYLFIFGVLYCLQLHVFKIEVAYCVGWRQLMGTITANNTIPINQ